MTARPICSSYTIDGLLGLNRDDESKQQIKPDQVTEQAPGHSTGTTDSGTVIEAIHFTSLQIFMPLYTSQVNWEVSRADSAFSHATMLFLVLVAPSPC